MTKTKNFGDLTLRLISATVLAIVASLAFYVGGDAVWVMLAIGGSLICWEYRRMMLDEVSFKDAGLWIMIAGCVAVVISANLFGFYWSFIPLIAAAGGLWGIRHKRPIWISTGMIYIGFPLAALVSIRAEMGFGTIFWLIAVVIASDVGGYFVGRQFGGPKLWKSVSPNKTWSGTVGGWVLAALVGFVYALFSGGSVGVGILTLSVGIAMSAQAGDLLESWIKRRQGVKDASNLIPGHGGLMDRFDGMLAATTVFMLTTIF